MKSTTIFVCDTCRYSVQEKIGPNGLSGGETLARAIEEAAFGGDLRIRRKSCLMGCEHPCNIAIMAEGKLGYVLGGFGPGPQAAEAICDYARLYDQSETGQVPFRQWPQGVKGHFIARIPVLDDAD